MGVFEKDLTECSETGLGAITLLCAVCRTTPEELNFKRLSGGQLITGPIVL